MANPWPGSLPCRPLVDGLDVEFPDGVIAFVPDVGPAITRRRTSYAPNVVQMRWRMTAAQVATFEEFFKDDLSMGSLPFTYVDDVTDSAADYKFMPGSPPRYSRVAPGRFIVSATLQRL